MCLFLLLHFQIDTGYLLRKSLKQQTETTVRKVIGVTRLAEVYNEDMRKFHKAGSRPGAFLALDNGYFATVSGSGDIYDYYLKNKQLGRYNGQYAVITRPNDEGYDDAKLRLLPFDHAFNFGNKKVSDRMCI